MASKFQQQYKGKSVGFANVEEGRYLRAEEHIETRRKHRTKVFNKNRDIVNSPNPAPEDSEILSAPVKEDRRMKLLRWKTERERIKKIEQMNKKPVFVAGVMHHKLYSPVTKNNSVKEVPLRRNLHKTDTVKAFPKGITKATERRLANKASAKELIKSSIKHLDCHTRKGPKKQEKQEQSIVPNNYTFKPPSGVQQMLFGRVPMESMSPHRFSELIAFSPLKRRASRGSNISRLKAEDSTKKLNASAEDEAIAENTKESSIEEVSLKLSSSDDEKLNLSNKNGSSDDDNNGNDVIDIEEKDCEPFTKSATELRTPPNNDDSVADFNSLSEPVFFSPYVVSSRGKSNARKEQQLRRGFSLGRSSTGEVPTKDTVMKDLNISVEEEERTARYFKFLVNRETDRLNELCEEWAKIKDDPEIIEDAQYQINQAIGQTKLLINKKFERFHRLVSDCETGKGEMLVTCKDLQGFWDMMYMEVKNCDLRFEKLEKLRSQNWKEDEEELPKRPIGKKKGATKKKTVAKKPSSIKSFLAEKKRKMAQKVEDGEDTDKFHVTEDRRSDKAEKNETSSIQYKTRRSAILPAPDKKFTPAKQKSTRLSLLREVQLSGRKIPSPLAVIKVSQMWKTPEVQLDNSISYVNSDQTPGRSILKQPKNTTNANSNIKSVQKVNFDENVRSNEIPVDEEAQLKRDLADALSRIDSLNFEQPSEQAPINAGKKLTYEDDSSEESEDVHGVRQNSEVKDSKSKSPIKVPLITLQTATPREGVLRRSLRRSLRRQNAVDEGDEKVDEGSNAPTNERDEGVRVLRNRRISSVDTPKLRKKSLRRMSMNVEESEHKENQTPSTLRRRRSHRGRTNNSK